MDWLLRPESIADKFLVMVIAIILFVAIMCADPVDHRPPEGSQLVGGRRVPRAGHDRHGDRSALSGARAPSYRSFQVSQAAVGPDGKPIINPQTGQKSTRAGLQPGQLRQGLHRPGLPEGPDQHRLVGHPGAGARHRLRPDLRGAGRPDPRREAGQGAGLPADGDLDGRRLDHLEVHVRVPAGGCAADRSAQPDTGVARSGSLPIHHHRTLEHLLPDRRDDLDPGRIRHDGAVRRDQVGARTTSSRPRRSTARPGSSCSARSPCRPSGRRSSSCSPRSPWAR